MSIKKTLLLPIKNTPYEKRNENQMGNRLKPARVGIGSGILPVLRRQQNKPFVPHLDGLGNSTVTETVSDEQLPEHP